MAVNEDGFVARVALRHGISEGTVRTVLTALKSGGGRMAQFSHVDFGGMSQWSPGMTMVGDMFNDKLKSKLNDVCTELVGYLADNPQVPSTEVHRDGVSFRRSSPAHADWWPAALGSPSSVGSQNDVRYAVFPSTRRLAIQIGHRTEIYDTGQHTIFGVAQAQSSDQTLTFTSQNGLLRIADLPKAASLTITGRLDFVRKHQPSGFPHWG